MSGKDPSAAVVGSFDTELLQLLARQGRRLPVPVFVVDAVIAGMAAQHVGWTLPLLWMGLVVLVLVARWMVFGRLPAHSLAEEAEDDVAVLDVEALERRDRGHCFHHPL